MIWWWVLFRNFGKKSLLLSLCTKTSDVEMWRWCRFKTKPFSFFDQKFERNPHDFRQTWPTFNWRTFESCDMKSLNLEFAIDTALHWPIRSRKNKHRILWKGKCCTWTKGKPLNKIGETRGFLFDPPACCPHSVNSSYRFNNNSAESVLIWKNIRHLRPPFWTF